MAIPGGLIRNNTETCVRCIAKVLESKERSASTHVRSEPYNCNAMEKAVEHEERQRSDCQSAHGKPNETKSLLSIMGYTIPATEN